jgi:predicted nucleotidyltransferase
MSTTIALNTLGTLLKSLREKSGMPLRKVAAYLDIDQAILSKIERGNRKATRNQVVKLAEYYKANESDLLLEWLSDKLVYEIGNEDIALKALHLAEEKISYLSYKPSDPKEIYEKLNTCFKRLKKVDKAWVFGSFARGENDYKSDIDVMIDVSDARFSLFDLADTQHELEQSISKKIDLVMYDSVKEDFLKRITPDLHLIYEK